MVNGESVKHKQSNSLKIRSEFQTVRLFAILGLLTIVFVLVVGLVQSGPNGFQFRQPANQAPQSILTDSPVKK